MVMSSLLVPGGSGHLFQDGDQSSTASYRAARRRPVGAGRDGTGSAQSAALVDLLWSE